MVSGFYILMRFFLRVDEVLVRMNDTRIYHQVSCYLATHVSMVTSYIIHTQAGSDHLIREYTSKEATISELKTSHLVPTSILTDPEKLSNILPVKYSIIHKLILPQQQQQ